MAKKISSKNSIPPSMTPEQVLPLLTRQIERIDEISKLQYDDSKISGWTSTTVNLLNDVFGQPNGESHQNTSNFEHASGGSMWVNMGRQDLQEHFNKKLSVQKGLLQSYVELLNDRIQVQRNNATTVPSLTSQVKKQREFQTTFAKYTVGSPIGEGGAGLVYSAKDDDGRDVAIKVLNISKATTEKRKRFKNELKFCINNKHKNIITVLDNGITENGEPFYVMPLFESSLRKLIGKIQPDVAFDIFTQILDGIDAAHKLGVVHRDLKPENILVSQQNKIVITDFGIASFEEEDMYTIVETKINAHMGNFQYAAPEQRARGQNVDRRTDIYSLGLILNELFTGQLALGLNFTVIGSVFAEYSYLDSIVSKMLEHSSVNRYQDIDAIKFDISTKANIYISQQKVSSLTGQVVSSVELDDSIVNEPVKVIGGDWDNGMLLLDLNHAPNKEWIWALNNMGGHTSALGAGPEMFTFSGKQARVRSSESDAQRIIDYFKAWLPQVERVYKAKLERDLIEAEERKKSEIKQIVDAEQRKQKIKSSLKF